MTTFPLWRIRSLIFGQPLAIHPAKFDAIVGAIGERLSFEVTTEQLEAAANSPKSQSKGYSVQDGIAIIPIAGSLMKKTSGLMAMSGSGSYETIGAQYQDAMKNPAIKGVLLAIDSPGGSTSGLFELADTMCKLKGDKPVYAISDDAAFSAAYALASVASKVYLTQTGGVGSIGVFCAHVDQSGADQKAGLVYSFIHAGDKKVDGNSHAPLSNTARADTQAEVDRQYQMFVSLVARNRGVSEDEIKNTEAGVFFGENAVPLLADCVGTFEDCLADLISVVNGTAYINSTAHGNLNNKQKHVATQEEHETMAKKGTEATIDELVAKHVAETLDIGAKAEEECSDEEMKSEADDDEEEDDKKKKKDDEDEDDEEDAKKASADLIRIVNLCAISGMPALASEFLANGYTVAQVEKALLKHRATKSKEVKILSLTTKPANDFASTANEIKKDKTITDKAAAYKQFLMNNPEGYLQSMLSRKNGENYSFLKSRGY